MDQEVLYPKLDRQPLTLVLAEFRFSRLQASVSSLYTFQNKMQQVFGEVDEYSTHTLRLAPDGSQEKATGWGFLFRAEEGHSLVQVEAERLVYITTHYPRFPAFRSRCLEAVALLEEQLAPEKLLRVGLRYNDAVIPGLEEELDAYIDHSLLPPASLATLGHPLAGHRTETQIQTDTGLLVARALVGNHGLAVMPDLDRPFQLAQSKAVPRDRLTAVLDFDHFWRAEKEQPELFTLERIKHRLIALHEPTREAFWRVTTDWARSEQWN
nr:TIGR04255 family protein [uncultured Halomonas sp.]